MSVPEPTHRAVSPGERIGHIVRTALDAHFNGEIKAYCERHKLTPGELEVSLTPTKTGHILATLGPFDKRLIVPQRRWKLTFRMSDAF